jgi:hypothetical protein
MYAMHPSPPFTRKQICDHPDLCPDRPVFTENLGPSGGGRALTPQLTHALVQLLKVGLLPWVGGLGWVGGVGVGGGPGNWGDGDEPCMQLGHLEDPYTPWLKKIIFFYLFFTQDGLEDECPVCLSELTVPVITVCRHIFCKPCIERVISLNKPSCPL